MRRRQWVREGDLIVIQPWEFQDEKANVCMRYTKTQSLYLSRKGVLPEIVDLFGMNKEDQIKQLGEDFEASEVEPASEVADEKPVAQKEGFVEEDDEGDIDSFFG